MINNRYHVLKLLGEGGFGRTYLTEDTHMPSRRKCVVKELKSIDNNSQIQQLVIDRFQREAATLEDLGENHSQIPKLYAYFAESNQFYLVQELVEGSTLEEALKQQGLMTEQRVKEILQDLLNTLQYVHSRGIIHRDIKPDNIIIRTSDRRPVLIDFGAVRETLGTMVNSQGQAVQSIVIGTPGYMSSEQAVGKPLFSSDLYSLGLTMVYLLTGKNPQELPIDNHTGTIHWRQIAPHVSPEFASILDKAIQPYARDRYLNVPAMIAALNGMVVTPAANPIGAANYPQNNLENSPSNYQSPPSIPPHQIPSPIPVTVPNYAPPYQNDPQQMPVVQSPPGSWVGGGGTFNTSAIVPPELQGWNWGAFLMAPLWCINNQVWIGLLSWIPYVGFIMCFIVGAKGNTWAWRSRKWENIAAFKANQRAWSIAGLSVWGIFIGLVVLAVAIVPSNTTTEAPEPATGNEKTTDPNTPSPPNTAKSKQGLVTQIVEFGTLSKYTYKNNLFSLSIPDSWEEKDETDKTEVLVKWKDKTGNAAILVDIFDQPEKVDRQEMGKMMTRVVEKVYKPKFKQVQIQAPIESGDGVKVGWSYVHKSGNKTVLMIANSYLRQEEDKIAIFTDVIPEEQSERLKSNLAEVYNSFEVDSNASLKETLNN
jgi:serine/threonine protein kinase